MPFAKADDGVKIHYEAFGNGPKNVIFMHGWAGSGDSNWNNVLEHMDKSGLRLIIFDIRGHGKSDKADKGLTHERLAADVISVADAAGADKFVIVGFSMSGRYAQIVTGKYPNRVSGQVLLAGAPLTPMPIPEDQLQFFFSGIGNHEATKKLLQMFIKKPVSDAALHAYSKDCLIPSRSALEETMRNCCTGDYTSLLKASAGIPTLAIGGKGDAVFTPDVMRYVISGISNARLVLIDAGHELGLEAPEETARLIEAFVAGVRV